MAHLAHKIWLINFKETDLLGEREAQGKRKLNIKLILLGTGYN
jgi:hypothetical protein